MNITCDECGQLFTRYPSLIKRRQKLGLLHNFCSKQCFGQFSGKEQYLGDIELSCTECTQKFIRSKASVNESNRLNKRPFCSKRCITIFNNKNKKYGTSISKLEKWLQIKLIELYPNLDFIFNSKETINSELDIYIPSLKLAFELNGIFHYEPIHGQKTLDRMQNNDRRKFQACVEVDISLCIIDTSSQKYFKESTSKQFLDIITSIIDGHGAI